MLPNATQVVAAPHEFGLTITKEPISKGSGNAKVLLANDAPMVTVSDLPKFLAKFGEHGSDLVLYWTNGTSLRVKVQSVTRPAIFKNRATNRARLLEDVINACLLGRVVKSGTRTVVVEKVVVRYAGATYESEVEAAAAMIADLVSDGLTVERARVQALRTFPGAAEVNEPEELDEENETDETDEDEE